MEILRITSENRSLVSAFLEIAGVGTLEKFRYYQSRPLEIIDNHLATFVVFHEEQSIAYGHLDEEEETIWLGIAISEPFQGKGIGTLMMSHLLTFARIEKIPSIKLAVDRDNEAAIPLYQKFGFKEINRTEKVLFMEWGFKDRLMNNE